MDMLGTKGNQIVDSRGHSVRLRGTCLGGWMNMENFINGYPGAESGVRNAVAQAIGPEKAQFLFERMLHYFFNEGDVRFLKSCGANVIRIPLNYRHFESDGEPFAYREQGFRRLDGVIDLCEKYGIYVILDLHAVQGWQNSHWHSDNPRGISLFWDQLPFQDRFVALWERIAERYAGQAAVAGYELMNEPATGTPDGDYPYNSFENYTPRWDRINAAYRRAAAAIRKADPRHILFIDGDDYAHMFRGLDEPFAENLVYTSHNYIAAGFGPGAYPGEFRTHRPDRTAEDGYWDRARQVEVFQDHEGTRFAREHQVPLWVGEFGAQYNGSPEEVPDRLRAMDDQLDVFEQFGAHWTTWTYKDVGVMGWMTLDPASEYMRLIEPVQRMKRSLGAENFTARFATSPSRTLVADLAAEMERVIENPSFGHVGNTACLSEAALAYYAAGLLEPVYAGLFRGMSEEEIDRVMSSFDSSRCIRNEGLITVLRKHMSGKG